MDLTPWLARIEARQTAYRRKIGSTRLKMLSVAARLLSTARDDRPVEKGDLQLPWLPCWPRLTAKPIHRTSDYAWTAILRQAYEDIREEMFRVRDSFERARYDSELNEKPWRVYYFYLQGKPFPEHLAACPKTREVLDRIPHNGLHVCFSAIEPGGSLNPHTGPTNTSLTAHLGLFRCSGSTLWVTGEAEDYRDGGVLLFDDSFVHWVENRGTETRYTLMITTWHPDLNRAERSLLSRLTRIAG